MRMADGHFSLESAVMTVDEQKSKQLDAKTLAAQLGPEAF
jgi:hypothetical protein